MKDKRRSASSNFGGRFQRLPWQVRAGGLIVAGLGLIYVLLPPSLFQSFNCEVQNLPQNYGSSNGYFIDNQVLVVGPRDDVDAVIGTPGPGEPTIQPSPTTPVPSTPFETPTTVVLLATGTPAAPSATATPAASERVILNFIEGCDLSYLNSRTAADSNSTVEDRELVMRLYEIPNGLTVGSVITDIGTIAQTQSREVFADPNYLIRLADSTTDPCALPTDGGGTGGRPFGGPGTLGGTYDAVRMEAAFNAQWALGSQGINLTPSPALTGRGVRVGVFDTSPYRIRWPFLKRIAEASPSPMWFTNWDAGGNTMMSNHGLFVASLIHRVAPKSSIQIVRVLNEDGCGDLWTLNKGLENYKSRKSAWTGKLNKTVINMSLGIRVPTAVPAGTTPTAEDIALEALQKEQLETLKSRISEADTMGAIVIASAGNDSTVKIVSGRTVVTKEPLQIPANYENVIGVVATNPGGGRSCYSNTGVMGDVAAPGGEGGTDPDDPNNLCVSRTSSLSKPTVLCTDMATCKYGLIGLAQTRYGRRFVLWSGTSFAAPLVSGMAALAYQDMGKAKAECLIKGGPTASRTPDPELGMGLIDMRDLTSTTALVACP